MEISMHRRLILTGIAAAAATPVLAQTQQPTPIQVTPQPANQPSSAAGRAQLGQAEIQHIQQTLAAGTVALQTSEIALQKAQNANVKEFAQFERDEQTTIAEVLRSLQDPGATASGGTSRGGATAPEISADKAKMMEQLQQAQAGAEFDRRYIEGQLQGHQELLEIQERYLQSNSQNREHVNVSKLARGHIKEHIARLQEIKKEVRG
jgi:putative membrane protein